jgi:hypothetical protein
MKARIVLALAMILLLAGSASVAADGAQVPFVTTLQVTPTFDGAITVPPYGFKLQVDGYGEVMHLGWTTWHAHQRVYGDGTLDAEMWFTAANGDELSGTYSGTGYRDANNVSHCTGTYEFTGGTGRFADVGGTGSIVGTHPPTGYGPLVFEGTLIKAEEP